MTGVGQLTKAGTKFRLNYARTVDSVALLMMDSYNPRCCDEAVLWTNEVASRDKVASMCPPAATWNAMSSALQDKLQRFQQWELHNYV